MQFKDNKKYQCAHCFCVAVIKYLIYLIESSKRGAVDLSYGPFGFVCVDSI